MCAEYAIQFYSWPLLFIVDDETLEDDDDDYDNDEDDDDNDDSDDNNDNSGNDDQKDVIQLSSWNKL